MCPPSRAPPPGWWYLNPGSVSIPKENSPHSYMILEGGVFTWHDLFLWKRLDGTEFDRLSL